VDSARAYLVILAGVLVGGALVGSTLRLPRPPVASDAVAAASRLHPLDLIARLTLGISLVLLALFLLAGRTFWAGTGEASPAWAATVGLALLIACLASGAIAAVFLALRGLRPR
jgi:hypothetical protein